ncbi:MAG: cadmium-translocating P-type ATPase [Clostridia bacterium]|nr:cadmium-translocating P-type ATPase [Clostridia bacterium]
MACDHEHCTQHHHSKEELEEKEDKKKEIILYVVAGATFLITFIPILPESVKIAFYVLTLLVSGYELFLEGIKNIFHFRFEEDTLMTIAVIAACCLGDFREACLVVLLFSLGEFIEDMAIAKSNRHIETIVDMKTDTANLYQENEIVIVPVENLKVGDKILIKPGEMVPVDSKVLSGKSTLDTSRLTGESEPTLVTEGQEILSGNSNLNGSLTAEVIREYRDSTASQIIDLVYEATNNKGKTEKFITKFSRIYTPTVIILALAISIIPILIGLDARIWITRALVFLVASCPCSIVISIPLGFFSCVGVLSKKGLLVKGTKHIEALAKAKTICFDKTGTITTGKMVIDEISESEKKKEFFSYVYSLEHLSNHPIAISIENEVEKQGWKKEELLQEVLEQEEIAGYGIKGVIQGKQVLFGNQKLLDEYRIPYLEDLNKKGIYIAVDGKLYGYITLKEEIRKGAENLKANLEKIGIHKIAMLTGDGQEKAEEISQKIGGIEIYASLLPKEKLEKVEEFRRKDKVIFVGDGINDSPVLATADFSISMGEGTQIASNTADSILISNQIAILPNIIKIAKSSMRIIYFNMLFSLLTKLVVLILGVAGYAPIWLAVFADVGVTLLTVLNSIRIYRK